MKMKKSIVLFSLIALNMKIVNSSSFCTDPDDYECKHLGISKCVPKLNRSTTQKPLPIEKPPCAVPCLDTNSWCEERGACIDKDELCDCGPDKIYCTSEDAYSCESRKGILQSHIFKICRNGECRKNCSMAEEEGTEGCGEGQFMCGGRCLDNVKVVQNRMCNQQCISVHKTCYTKQEEVSVVINDTKQEEVSVVINDTKQEEVSVVINNTKQEEVSVAINDTKQEEVSGVINNSEIGFSSHWIYVIFLCFSWFLIGVLVTVICCILSNSNRIQYLNNTTTDHKNISEDSATNKNNMLQMNKDCECGTAPGDSEDGGSDSDSETRLYF